MGASGGGGSNAGQGGTQIGGGLPGAVQSGITIGTAGSSGTGGMCESSISFPTLLTSCKM